MNRKNRCEISVFRPFSNVLSVFEDDLLNFGLSDLSERSILKNGFFPAIDIENRKDRYIVKAELPGLLKDDIKVNVRDNTLVIAGEKKYEKKKDEDGYYFSERSYGSFYRSIPLAKNVVTDKVKAKYDKGVLEVELPKDKDGKADNKVISIE